MEKCVDAYCGLYCGSCLLFAMTAKGMKEEIETLLGMPYDEAACSGCKSDQVSRHCRVCGLKSCAQKRGYDDCSECAEYPCSEMKAFIEDPKWPYHIETPEYIRLIRETGKENWIREMEKRWACTECGKSYTWFEMECGGCGAPVKGYRKPV